MLRSATAALLRTSTEISSICAVSTARSVRQTLCYPPLDRPFSTSVCLWKKKKTSLWLQLAEGHIMEGNIEEILAPLRLAVKEQVTFNDTIIMCRCLELNALELLLTRLLGGNARSPCSPVHLTGCCWKCQSESSLTSR